MAGLLFACSSRVTGSTDVAAAVKTVIAYYDALSSHHFSEAESHLAPATRSMMQSGADPPAGNLLSLKNLTIEHSGTVDTRLLPGMPPGMSIADFDSFAVVTVDYDAEFRQVLSEPNGRLTRFLYLGRTGQGRHWQILAIGSGP